MVWVWFPSVFAFLMQVPMKFLLLWYYIYPLYYNILLLNSCSLSLSRSLSLARRWASHWLKIHCDLWFCSWFACSIADFGKGPQLYRYLFLPVKQMSEHEEYRCFIGGLSWSTSDRSLKEAFEKFGHLVEAKVIIVIICV